MINGWNDLRCNYFLTVRFSFTRRRKILFDQSDLNERYLFQEIARKRERKRKKEEENWIL